MPADSELLDRWRAGDESSGEQLFERHFEAIARFFANKVGQGVDDLIQKTFLACIEGRDSFRGESTFRTFLFGVAHNVLGKHYRTQRRDGERIDFGVTSVHDLGPGPSTLVARRREQQVLLDALTRIPLELQVLLELYYWENMTAAEAGAVVGIPEGTARTRIRRAKQLLSEQLQAMSETEDKAATRTDLRDWARALEDELGPEPRA
jgi:RNA polymerase sigma factor (sigma-70 family)